MPTLVGGKAWCTDGSFADLIIVFAKTAVEAGKRGLSAFCGANDAPGPAIERFLRDAEAFEIFDGPTQIQNMIIGRSLARDGLPF